VAEQLAKKGKPFTYAEFVISCILATAEELCPEKIKLVQDSAYSYATNRFMDEFT
jgi:hypothetical protein